MELVRNRHDLKARKIACVATIGAFDGVHLGHQSLLRRVVELARERSLNATVVSFEPTPKEYFLGAAAPARLTPFRERYEIFRDLGLDRFVCLRFGETLKTIEPEAFVDEILVEELVVKHLVVGDDFRFARGRAGDLHTLIAGGTRHAYTVESIHSVMQDDRRISSTAVREALDAGELARTRSLLGRHYRMSGQVVRGQELGRKLGFPTANIQVHRKVLPLSGVFAVRVHGITDTGIAGVANLGTRPTVCGREPLLEVYLFDFSGELYGRHISVDFIARLRDELKFEDLEAMKAQMDLDARQAREILRA